MFYKLNASCIVHRGNNTVSEFLLQACADNLTVLVPYVVPTLNLTAVLLGLMEQQFELISGRFVTKGQNQT